MGNELSEVCAIVGPAPQSTGSDCGAAITAPAQAEKLLHPTDPACLCSQMSSKQSLSFYSTNKDSDTGVKTC